MFSGIVKITDLDDYITPSQNCIKPLLDTEEPIKEPEIEITLKIKTKSKAEKISLDKEIKDNNIKIESQPDLIKSKNNNNTAKVNLYDCLACSGCVTTAETLLIEQHSIDELIKNSLLESNLSVMSISPQIVYSLARNYNAKSIEQCFNALLTALSKAGVAYVVNYDIGVKLALNKAYDEYTKRKSSFILSSECPGWICYAEKKAGEWIQEHLSKIKSPQQILGHLIKTVLPSITNMKSIYHCVLMPCFDKKLESSREENTVRDKEGNIIKEVDNVISTIELEELFNKLNINFSELVESNEHTSNIKYISLDKYFDSKYHGNTEINDVLLDCSFSQFFYSKYNFTSNGYAEYILNRYVEDNNLSTYEILRKTVKNSDFKELILEVNGKEELKFALIYGFRNIQNILRKKDAHKYSYIEIMACPGGCLNGGAQYKPKNGMETSREVLKELETNIINDISKLNSASLTNISNLQSQVLNLIKSNEILTTNEEDRLYEAKFKVVKETIFTSLKW